MAFTTLPAAGAKLRGSVLNSLITEVRPVSARKTADEIVNNSAVFQDDNDLFVAVEANATYWAQLHVLYQSAAAAAFKYQFTFPAGATLPMWSFIGKAIGPTLTHDVAASGGVAGLAGTGTNCPVDAQGVIIVSATAGTVRVQWAQNTANVSDTTVRAGSSLVLTRLT